MTIPPDVIGIDVSKAHLDVYDAVSRRHRRLDNDEASVTALVKDFSSDSFVVFEATGAYDACLRRLLAQAGVRHARVNPTKARAFARAAGFLAKTDKIDAAMLAAMGQCLTLKEAEAGDAGRERLALLNKRRDQLVAMRKQEKTRRCELDADLRQDIDRHIAWIDEAVVEIEARIKALIAGNQAMREKTRLMISVPGVGRVTAATLAALMPELGQRSPKTIAALAGLAPLNVESGQHRGKRRIRDGRSRVRRALFMAAITAARSKSRFATLYRSLRAAGKPAKVALIAIARKILVTLNAIIRTNVAFQN